MRTEAPVCPYCGHKSKPVKGYEIYPYAQGELAMKNFFQCMPCDARVGTHKVSGLPLGRLADEELRKAKMKAHGAFDVLWREKYMTRGEAYAWLAGEMDLEIDACHIGMFDVKMCNEVYKVSQLRLLEVQDECDF